MLLLFTECFGRLRALVELRAFRNFAVFDFAVVASVEPESAVLKCIFGIVVVLGRPSHDQAKRLLFDVACLLGATLDEAVGDFAIVAAVEPAGAVLGDILIHI